MKKMAVLLFLMVGSSALATLRTYDLKVNLTMNGKHVSSPQIIAKEGETASMTQELNGEKIFMDVIATENTAKDKNAIFMKFSVGTISAKGEKKIISTPQILALENQKAEIQVVDEKDHENLSISVVAIRKL